MFLTAYETLIAELKVQIEDLKLENETLRQNDAHQPVLALFRAMTNLSVFCTYHSDTTQRFSCSIVEGGLKGLCRSVLLWALVYKTNKTVTGCFDCV